MKEDASEKASPAAGEEVLAPVALNAQEIASLKDRAAKADENWDRFLHLAADFDNYKKRAARERQEAVTFANEALLKKLIPTLDAFEMALAAAKPDPASQSLRDGIEMVSNQLKSTLAEAGLEEIDAAGDLFDPACHEALSQQETAKSPKAASSSKFAKATNSATDCSAPPASSWPKTRPPDSAYGQTRLLRSPRRGAERRHRGDQKGLPQAGPQVSSRPQSPRQKRGGKIQGTGRGLRGPQRSRIRAPPTTATATPPLTRAPAGPAPADSTIRATSSAKFSAAAAFSTTCSDGGTPRRRATASAATICATTWRSPFWKRRRAARRKSPSTSLARASLRRQRGGERLDRQDLPDLRRPRPGHQFARHFQHRPDLPALRRARAYFDKPCRPAAGAGAANAPPKSPSRFPPGWTPASRLRSSGNGEAGVHGGPARRPVRRAACPAARDISARWRRSALRSAHQFRRRRRWGRRSRCPRWERRCRSKSPPARRTGRCFASRARRGKNVQGYGQGDLLARVQVEVPTRLNPEQKGKLEEFARLCDERVHPLSKSFFDRAKSLFSR